MSLALSPPHKMASPAVAGARVWRATGKVGARQACARCRQTSQRGPVWRGPYARRFSRGAGAVQTRLKTYIPKTCARSRGPDASSLIAQVISQSWTYSTKSSLRARAPRKTTQNRRFNPLLILSRARSLQRPLVACFSGARKILIILQQLRLRPTILLQHVQLSEKTVTRRGTLGEE